MMAASVKHIIAAGGILDTILHWASSAFANTGPFASAMMIYGLTLVLELFITSGSAKAFLLIPILMPLADLVGVNRQIAVSAYTFGDGFSNMAYPTNAALLITLSLTVIPFVKWLSGCWGCGSGSCWSRRSSWPSQSRSITARSKQRINTAPSITRLLNVGIYCGVNGYGEIVVLNGTVHGLLYSVGGILYRSRLMV
jgi:hypothetical protein